jgi:hypothetical protein
VRGEQRERERENKKQRRERERECAHVSERERDYVVCIFRMCCQNTRFFAVVSLNITWPNTHRFATRYR